MDQGSKTNETAARAAAEAQQKARARYQELLRELGQLMPEPYHRPNPEHRRQAEAKIAELLELMEHTGRGHKPGNPFTGEP